MTDQIEQLERLARLRGEGALNDEEFEAQKATLLASASALKAEKPNIPPAIAAVIFIIALGVGGLVVKALWPKDELPAAESLIPVASTPTIPVCDSADVRSAVTNAIEQNASSNIATLRLLDMTNVSEIAANEAERLCAATLVLNSGEVQTRVRVSLSTQGETLVMVGQNVALTPTTVPAEAAPAAGAPLPITTMAATHAPGRYTGVGEGEVELVLKADTPDAFQFDLSTTAPGCSGSMSGTASVDGQHLVATHDENPNCQIVMTRTPSGYDVDEGDCALSHGATCAFVGSLQASPAQ